MRSRSTVISQSFLSVLRSWKSCIFVLISAIYGSVNKFQKTLDLILKSIAKSIYIFFKLFCTLYNIKFGTFFDTLIFKDKEKIFFRIFAVK
jgi:hypothetical protein